MKKLWMITFLAATASLITGGQAIFTNGGNGNTEWFLAFWLFTVGAGVSFSLMLARHITLSGVKTINFTALVAGILFLFSNPIGLMVFFALPLLLAFYICAFALLVWIPVSSRIRASSNNLP